METSKSILLLLFAHGYWATRKVLAAAAELDASAWTGPGARGEPSLRGSLAHAFRVEKSWRLLLKDGSDEYWNRDLSEDFPTVVSLQEAWADDEREMMDWLAGLTDEDLAKKSELGWEDDAYTLGFLLLHVVTHTSQPRAEAALIVSRAGHSPGNLDLLDYLDWKVESARR
jgi:uncharacterized damage-inducible protein DinB